MKSKGLTGAELISELLNKAAKQPNLHSYVPHAKQEAFHRSEKFNTLYLGGNRAGKTVAGIIEDIWRLTKTHPFKKTHTGQIRGRYVATDFPNGVEKIALPVWKQWLPTSYLINGSWEDSWSASKRTLTLKDGSFIEFMSNDQELDSFAGTSRHFVHFDEEPDKAVFNENKMRLIDTEGVCYITMTPVEGMTWVYEDLWENRDTDPDLLVVQVDMDDNPYLTEAGKAVALSGLSHEEKLARKQGKFVAQTGLIFRDFDPEQHVIPPVSLPVPPTAIIYESMDHGYNNPTAWHWHAVFPNGKIVTFAEHYKRELVVDEHAVIVKEKRRELKVMGRIHLTVGDPAIAQRSAVTGNSIQTQYRLQNIFIALGKNDVAGGINKMNAYLKSGMWVITEDCPNLIKEIRRYRWKTWESKRVAVRNNVRDEPHKKDDHAVDGCRYFMSFMPDLAPDPPPVSPPNLWQHGEILNAQNPALLGRNGYKFTLPPVPQVSTEWTHIDEHLGGIW